MVLLGILSFPVPHEPPSQTAPPPPAELYSGRVLFHNDSVQTMMARDHALAHNSRGQAATPGGLGRTQAGICVPLGWASGWIRTEGKSCSGPFVFLRGLIVPPH